MSESSEARAKHRLYELTSMQMSFIKHYTQSLDKKDAAIKAGYNPRDAAKRAHAILKKPQVQKFLGKAIRNAVARQDEAVQNELGKTLSVVETIIESGTTAEKLAKATVGDALNAIGKKADLLGLNAPTKNINVNVGVDLDRAQRLTDKIKEKERGY